MSRLFGIRSDFRLNMISRQMIRDIPISIFMKTESRPQIHGSNIGSTTTAKIPPLPRGGNGEMPPQPPGASYGNGKAAPIS